MTQQFKPITRKDPPAISRCAVLYNNKPHLALRDFMRGDFLVVVGNKMGIFGYKQLGGYRLLTEEEWDKFALIESQAPQQLPQEQPLKQTQQTSRTSYDDWLSSMRGHTP